MAEDSFQAVDLCNKCGFCQAGCPVYKVTGIEWTTARGRVALVKDFLDGRIPLDEEMREPLYNCLTCDGCVDHCPPGVPTSDIIIRARQEMLSRLGQPWPARAIFRGLLPYSGRLALAAKLLRLAQRAGALSLAGRLHADLRHAASVLPPLPAQHTYSRLKAILRPPQQRKLKVAYFIGCAAAELFPQVAEATVRVLQRHGAEVLLPPFACCGKPPQSYGDLEAARFMARQNVALAAGLDVDAIVTACATCSGFLKQYGRLLGDDERGAAAARAFSAKVRDVTELLIAVGLNEELGPLAGLRLTWHDPCHLGRSQKIAAQPRAILKRIPGVDFVELPEASMCCGGAGTYNLTHHDISTRVLARKMDNLARTGAHALVTSCPACTMQLAYGIRQHGLAVEMLEIVQVLDRAYQAQEQR